MRHSLKLVIQHPTRGTIPIGEIDLSDVDPTDEDVPLSLSDQLFEMLDKFYASQRLELADVE